MANHGYDVALISRTESELKSVATEVEKCGREAIILPIDISVENQIVKASEYILNKFDRVDTLVNNAGIGIFKKVVNLDTEEFDKMFSVNMRGLFLMTKYILPRMIAQNSGDIVNISSLAGRNSFVGGAGYSATKWAVIGFARSLMLEIREYNIRVITICPGSVGTTFSTRLKVQNSIPKADDIAQVVIDSLLMPRHVMVSEIDVRPTNPN